MRGYEEEGMITTPFDMAVLNDLDRFHLGERHRVRRPTPRLRRSDSRTPGYVARLKLTVTVSTKRSGVPFKSNGE